MSSKRRIRRKSCQVKTGYPTKEEAERRVKQLVWRDYQVGPQTCAIRAYRCDHCGQWHVGHAGHSATHRRHERG